MADHAKTLMQEKVCLVTGATSGIGLITARTLAAEGAIVVVAGRNPERTAATIGQITQETGNSATAGLVADLSVQAQVRQLAQEFQQRYRRLDVLVNNAGALFTTRQLSADGIEMTFALNHLAYFLLTHLLLGTLTGSAPARVINVSSDAHRGGRLDFGNLQGERRYGGWRAYKQSKLANILFTYELARRLEGSGVTVNALHPGFVATNFGDNNRGFAGLAFRVLKLAAMSPEEGAQTMIYLATAPEVEGVSGKYFVRSKAVPSSRASYDQPAAQRLWDINRELTSV